MQEEDVISCWWFIVLGKWNGWKSKNWKKAHMQPLGGVGVVSFPSTITLLLEDFLTPYHSLPIIGNFLRVNYFVEFENKVGRLNGKMGCQISEEIWMKWHNKN